MCVSVRVFVCPPSSTWDKQDERARAIVTCRWGEGAVGGQVIVSVRVHGLLCEACVFGLRLFEQVAKSVDLPDGKQSAAL